MVTIQCPPNRTNERFSSHQLGRLLSPSTINGINGAFYGNQLLLLVEAFTIVAVTGFTFGSFLLVKHVGGLFTTLRVSAEEEEQGWIWANMARMHTDVSPATIYTDFSLKYQAEGLNSVQSLDPF